MAAGAFHFDAKECGANDEAFRGHGNVVLRSDAKASRTAELFRSFHPDEFGDHEVERFVIDE